MMSQYKVKTISHPIDCQVTVPGSKSITNRALLMAALSDGICRLNGVLFSDDSRHFLQCLKDLGYDLEIQEEECTVQLIGLGGRIPKKNATIYVGSAGTAARFLTAMLALSDGEYTIDASEQMQKRPMKPLFTALTSMGAQFEYLAKEGYLPVKVTGAGFGGRSIGTDVDIDISESTQFLSALMMVAPVLENGLNIHITSEKTDGSYIRITRKMMEQYGAHVEFNGKDYCIGAKEQYQPGDYDIEPDVSAASYFYAAAAITGGNVIVRGVHSDSMQGDLKFLDVLQQMGCMVEDTEQGIHLQGPKKLHGISINMNDFSDQALTLSAIAPFAEGVTKIEGIGHIRKQESDRIHAIVTELRRMGITVEEEDSAVTITPGNPQPAVIETYEDHRVAMSFALVGLLCEGIVIDNYMCCRKTFEKYFDVLETL